jgi:hypothetical protein
MLVPVCFMAVGLSSKLLLQWCGGRQTGDFRFRMKTNYLVLKCNNVLCSVMFSFVC